MSDLPAITGEHLVTLLEKDGWKNEGKATHGVALSKMIDGRKRVVIIPVKKSKSLNKDTLHRILSVKQSGIGRQGLIELMNKHG